MACALEKRVFSPRGFSVVAYQPIGLRSSTFWTGSVLAETTTAIHRLDGEWPRVGNSPYGRSGGGVSSTAGGCLRFCAV
jgi:hypothetical protein